MFKDRLKKLEQMGAAGDGAMLAALLRRSNAEGATMSGAIAVMESERGRPLDAGFVQRAERISASVKAMVVALFAVAP